MTDVIVRTICETVASHGRSSGMGSMWRRPLVAFASADDPRFLQLQQAVSPSHLMPEDLLAGAKTVVCFFIPFTEELVHNNIAGDDATHEWALCYVQTNQLIKLVCSELTSLLGAEGYKAGVVPATHNFDEQRLISDWSHRHAAWIAGLGSFGENNMLITDDGCCGRFGSLATDWQFPQDGPVAQVRERCLSRQGKTCDACRKKCPVGAYSGGSFDRHACYAHCMHNAALHGDVGLADVCGKCICGLPCSLKSP